MAGWHGVKKGISNGEHREGSHKQQITEGKGGEKPRPTQEGRNYGKGPIRPKDVWQTDTSHPRLN